FRDFTSDDNAKSPMERQDGIHSHLPQQVLQIPEWPFPNPLHRHNEKRCRQASGISGEQSKSGVREFAWGKDNRSASRNVSARWKTENMEAPRMCPARHFFQ